MPLSFPPVLLASASPRRRELLAQIGVDHEVVRVEVPELALPGEAPEVFALRLALAKARAGRAAAGSDPRPVLGADTVVVAAGEILGKPHDRADFLRMMRLLAGHTHQVMTAVARVDADGCEASRLSVSHVTFRPLRDEEIEAYWACGEPADKAGGYAIQGRAAMFIAHVEGSYSGVMGLPLFETAELLRNGTVRS
ncbi:MAG TPA: Maf family protein [Gammaproteobacteria bacterium]